jgi:hypothetical protein
LRHL